MPKQKIEVEIESSGYAIMVNISKIAAAQKSGNGLAEALVELQSTISAAVAVPADLKEDPKAFIHGVVEGAFSLLGVL